MCCHRGQRRRWPRMQYVHTGFGGYAALQVPRVWPHTCLGVLGSLTLCFPGCLLLVCVDDTMGFHFLSRGPLFARGALCAAAAVCVRRTARLQVTTSINVNSPKRRNGGAPLPPLAAFSHTYHCGSLATEVVRMCFHFMVLNTPRMAAFRPSFVLQASGCCCILSGMNLASPLALLPTSCAVWLQL